MNTTRKFAKKPYPKKGFKPARKSDNSEVMVFDVIQKEVVIAEYRNETVQWFGTKMFKVYHPAFKECADNHRLVYEIQKTLGPLPEGAPMVQETPALNSQQIQQILKEVTA